MFKNSEQWQKSPVLWGDTLQDLVSFMLALEFVSGHKNGFVDTENIKIASQWRQLPLSVTLV